METTTANSSQWEWTPCSYDFKQVLAERDTSFFNLAPTVVLSDTKGNGKELKVDINIDSEKNFLYSEELGWNWHKSWNIPNLKVRVEIHDPDTKESLPMPKHLSVKQRIFHQSLTLFDATAIIEQIERFHLLDVGIKGESKKYVVDQEVYFSTLKFSSTSYNNDSVKFHLVICVQIDSQDDEIPQIVSSFISPPVFVDSRKSARDSDKIKAKQRSSLIDPFLPENLNKTFVKIEKFRKGRNPEEITNSIEGLVNYFTAPNIRHKVKHPLFLALKFSNCISLYYNTIIFKPDHEDRLVENIQNRLYESQLDSNSQKISKLEKAPLIMVLKNACSTQNTKSKKIIEHLESIQNSSLLLIYDNEVIPLNVFKELVNITELKAKYKKVYSLLSCSKFKAMSSLAKRNVKINEDEIEEESQDETECKDTGATTTTKKFNPQNKTMLEIPLCKQPTTADSLHLSKTKGKMPKPIISNLEQRKVKKINSNESVEIKNEEKASKNTNSPQSIGISKIETSDSRAGINYMEDEKTKSSISTQLELMNRLLIINAAIGIKNQSQQNNSTPQSSQDSQTLSSILQNQEILTEMDMSQLVSLVQGFLGQNSGAENFPSLNQGPMSILNNTAQPFNMNSRSMEAANYFNPQASHTRQNELQKILMQQAPPSNNGFNSQLYSNQPNYSPLSGSMSTYASMLNQGAQSMMSSALNYQNFQNLSFIGHSTNANASLFSGMLNPKGLHSFKNTQGSFPDMFRQVSSNFPRYFESGDDSLQKTFSDMKEEERHN